MNDNENSQEKKLSIKFFNLGEAIKEVKDEFDYGTGADKVKSSAKLVGKTIFNAGLLAGKVGAAVIKHAPDVMARQAHKNIKNNPDMSNEDKEKHEKVIKYNEELKIKKQAKK
jgi:hypothetical protein